VVRPLDAERLRREARALRARGVRIAAVSLLHADRHPAHEAAAAGILREEGFRVVLSCETAPRIGYLARTQTTLIEAALGPVIHGYLDRVEAALPGVRLSVMTSAAALRPRATFRPSESLLSGPAAGAIGAAVAAGRSGFRSVISFDMGGTSTDVARIDGSPRLSFSHRIEGAEVLAPAVAIETVAAGGGSVCAVSPVGLSVGPGSAGADPGPACYGTGGPLTITDVNLLLGRLLPDRFGVPLVHAAAEEAFAGLLERAKTDLRRDLEPHAALEGLLDIANEKMAGAIRRVSTRDGYDPAAYGLLAFGGAGPQHACAVARRLGIRTVIVPPDAGILSAVGLEGAAFERIATRQVLATLDALRAGLSGLLAELDGEAEALVAADAPGSSPRIERRIAAMRLVGQESWLDVELSEERPEVSFAKRYREVYGHEPEGRGIEVVSVRSVAAWREPGMEAAVAASAGGGGAVEATSARFDGRWVRTPVLPRDSLGPGATVEGPAIITESHATTVVEPGWKGVVDEHGALILTDSGADAARATVVAGASAARVELLANRLTSIAQEMGEALRRTAVSTNVKERLDFSCAVLDPEGQLLANAPHVPVHLGSLGLCVREVARRLELRPGDAALTNHPAFGGSHLPDLTVLMPVHADDGARLAWVAARAHHAEIGGVVPGSMNPGATSLADEGVAIAPMKIIEGGRPRLEALSALLASPAPPQRASRAIADNLADVHAALAALHAGARGIRMLATGNGGTPALLDGMEAISARSDAAMRRALVRCGDGRREAEERLDDGSPLRVRIDLAGGEAAFDFAGSAPVHPGARNATPAIVRSAVLYVLRLMIDEPLPLNEGLLRPVSIRLPRGMLNPPFHDDPSRCPAVGAGNVETSQRLVDTLIKALGLAACSQGTMNNVIFGNDRFSYYETVCGGAGAGRGFDGCSAVHTHMTNTRITDPEILEHRHPVRLERFGIRRGSGGSGGPAGWRGGDGAIREITFLEPVTLSIIAEHRRGGPCGIAGGEAGAPGAQRLVRADGTVRAVGDETFAAGAGDRLILETPGGGGCGAG
jgi:5-oxoprolinase (ATP-hydrolysing)